MRVSSYQLFPHGIADRSRIEIIVAAGDIGVKHDLGNAISEFVLETPWVA